MTLDEGHYIYFCCDKLWNSKFMALEKPGKLKEFFSPTLWRRGVVVNTLVVINEVTLCWAQLVLG